MKSTQKYEMYMPNARNVRLGPNATYIPLTCVGGLHWGNTNFRSGVGGNANFRIFRYQHVSIPNIKLWRWGSKPTPGSDANGFASHWTIGFKLPVMIMLESDTWCQYDRQALGRPV